MAIPSENAPSIASIHIAPPSGGPQRWWEGNIMFVAQIMLINATENASRNKHADWRVQYVAESVLG